MSNFVIGADGIPAIKKVNTSRLDYSFDFSKWLLAIEDTIDTFSVTAADGITIDTTNQSGGIVTSFVEGGTPGTTYLITCEITTEQGRIDSRSINIQVVSVR